MATNTRSPAECKQGSLVLLFPQRSDYINASFMDGYKHRNAYIGTQGTSPTSTLVRSAHVKHVSAAGFSVFNMSRNKKSRSETVVASSDCRLVLCCWDEAWVIRLVFHLTIPFGPALNLCRTPGKHLRWLLENGVGTKCARYRHDNQVIKGNHTWM